MLKGRGGNLAMILHPTQGGVATLLVASCHGDRDKFRLGELIGSNICFTLFFFLFFLPINYQVKTLKRVSHLVIFILQLLSSFPWYSKTYDPFPGFPRTLKTLGNPACTETRLVLQKRKKCYLPLFGNWNEGLWGMGDLQIALKLVFQSLYIRHHHLAELFPSLGS